MGKDKFMDDIIQAGSSRFRPITLTSLTTMAGLFPLIIANDPDAQHIVPMAISVAYGVIVATFLTLLVLPVLLVIINSMKRWIERFKTGEMPSRESVERAVQELDVNNLI